MEDFPTNHDLPEPFETDTLEEVLEQAVAKRLDHVIVALIPKLEAKALWGITSLHLASAIRSADKLHTILRNLMSSTARLELINARVHLDSRVWRNWTPLHVGVRYGQLESVQLLLSFGADVTATAARMTPLHLAHSLGNEKMLDVLLSRIDNTCAENLVDGNMVSHLHLACSRGELHATQALLKAGADVEARIPSRSRVWPGLRPFGVAVRYAHIGVIRVLLDHCADATQISRDARRIIRRRSHRIIDRLASDGFYRVDLEPAFRGQNETLLQYACRRGYVGLTKVLLRHGAQVNSNREEEATPLRLAIANGHEILVRLLLTAGADPRSRTPGGLDALDALVGCAHNLNRRRAAGTPIDKLRRYYVRMIDAFLGAGMNGEDVDRALRHSTGNSAASYALLEHGADVNAEDACGKTALWHHVHANPSVTPTVYLVFRRHLRRMSFLGIPVSQQNLQLCLLQEIRWQPEELPEEEVDLARSSAEERESLMHEFLEDQRTSLYDVISKSPEELFGVSRSKTLRLVISSDDLHDRFPVYGFLLRFRCTRLSQLSQAHVPMES